MGNDNWLRLSQTIDGAVSEKWPEIPQLNQPSPGGQASSSGAAGFVYRSRKSYLSVCYWTVD